MKNTKALLLLAPLVLVLIGLVKFDGNKTPLNLQPKRQLAPWKPGFLDIHHLHVGSSVSSFMVTPDGTTILVDAGEIDVEKQRQWWMELGLDQLQAVDPYPNSSKRPSQWILEYLKHFWPNTNNRALDYVLVTHFHGDHFGDAGRLSGIPAIAQSIPIRQLIDRGFPGYDFPRDLRKIGDENMDNYLAFVANASSNIPFEQFQVGSTQQIQQQYSNDDQFRIQVLKSSATVLVNGSTATIPGTILNDKGQWNENTMSAAFVVEYGEFRYYEGGDQEIVRKDKTVVFDTIGPTARAAGRVDVATLNHHGHGVTDEFVQSMDPSVMILQGWCSDQPATQSVERLAGRMIFATYIFPQRLEALGPSLSKLFRSTEGHVVVRVHPPSQEQAYEILVLDGDRRVQSHHGPYPVEKKGSQ